MKKTIKATSAAQRARTVELARQDLTAVIGGHNGTIIVESAVPHLPGGIQGSGLQKISGG